MRTPVQATLVPNGNGNGNGDHPNVVRATLIPPRNEDGTVPSEPLIQSEIADDDDLSTLGQFDSNDDEPTTRDAHIPVGHVPKNLEAPWSPVPLRQARDLIRENPDCALEVIFPTVYDEDRSKKLTDLSVAETAGAITHQRMAEQMAKELGFDNYKYDEELQAIELEHQTLPPFILQGAPETTGLVGSRPATGQPAQAVGKGASQPGAAGPGAAGPGAAAGPGSPAIMTAAPEAMGFGSLPPMPAMPPVQATAVHREPLSGDSKAKFRKQQRSMNAMERQIRRQRRRTESALAEVLRRVEAAKPTLTPEMFLEALGRLVERLQPPPISVAPPNVTIHPPAITVEAPRVEVAAPVINIPEQKAPVVNVTVEPPKPKHVVIERDNRGLAKSMREVDANDHGSEQAPAS
jgi:hypothetical protein